MNRSAASDTVTRASLLARPHHDGSAMYVSDIAPRPGDTVTVRVRVPHAAGVDEVHVRQVTDGEPEVRPARRIGSDDVEAWWEADVVCHNPVTNYRFVLRGGPTGYQWLNGTGVHERDVPDAADFRITTYDPPPEWALDAVVYQVFPDRFARAADAPPVDEIAPEWAIPAAWDEPVAGDRETVGQQLYGGDLVGLAERLDHLQRLGVTTLYLTPVFPGRSNHRYDAATFEGVDPILGGDDALRRVVREAHARGLRVLGDLTTNHTGDAHDWFAAAQRDEHAPERDYYLYDEDGTYVSWLGVPSLPKLNHASPGLAERLFDAPDSGVRRWLGGEDGLDGWRVDVANMTGRWRDQDLAHDVARRMRRAVTETVPDGLLVGEHCHDHSQDADGDGWHGVMNYSGFTRPVWTWLRHREFAPKFLGLPLMVPRLDGSAVAETMDEFSAIVPWRSRIHSFTLLGSHDTTRVRTLVETPEHVMAAAALLLTMPGIPMITYGDEIGMAGDFGEDGRRPMPWDESDWDRDIFAAYQKLIEVRHELEPLRRGGFRWVAVDDDALVFLRETATETVLVAVARSAYRLSVRTSDLPGIDDHRTVMGRPLETSGRETTLVLDGPGAGVWTWRREVMTWP